MFESDTTRGLVRCSIYVSMIGPEDSVGIYQGRSSVQTTQVPIQEVIMHQLEMSGYWTRREQRVLRLIAAHQGIGHLSLFERFNSPGHVA